MTGRREALRWAVVLGIVVGALALAHHLSHVFNPLLLGLLFAYIFNPLVERLEAKGISRGKAVSVLFGVVLLGLAAVTSYATFKAAQGLTDLHKQFVGERALDPDNAEDAALIAQSEGKPPPPARKPSNGEAQVSPAATAHHAAYVRKADGEYFLDLNDDGERRVGLVEQITLFASAQLGDLHVGQEEWTKLARGLEEHAGQFTSWGIKATDGLRKSFGQISTFFSYLLLVPVYTFFLLMGFTHIRESIRDHLPGAYREQVVRIATRIDVQVAAFFRGKLTLCVIKGVVTWIGLWISGVPFSFAIGMSAGFLSIVPFAGPLVGGVLSVLLAYSADVSFGAAIIGIVVTFIAAEGVEAVAQPVVLGAEVGMNPVLLLLSFFVFGDLFGLFGLLLAVPIMSVFKTLFEEVLLPEIRELAGKDGPPGEGAEPSATAPAVPTFARAAAAAAEPPPNAPLP